MAATASATAATRFTRLAGVGLRARSRLPTAVHFQRQGLTTTALLRTAELTPKEQGQPETPPGESATAHDHRVHDLSAKVWGFVARDEGAMMPVVTGMLGEFWKVNEPAMAGLPLEKGLLLLGRREARLIETKWRQQLDEEMQTQMQRHNLTKEICGLLNNTIMDLEP